MTVISLEEVQAKLSEIVHNMPNGGEFLIMDGEKAVARLRVEPNLGQKKTRELGTMRGTVQYMAPDFDAPLDDFQDYQ